MSFKYSLCKLIREEIINIRNSYRLECCDYCRGYNKGMIDGMNRVLGKISEFDEGLDYSKLRSRFKKVLGSISQEEIKEWLDNDAKRLER